MYKIEDIKKEYLKGKSLRYSETKNIEIKDFIDKNISIDIPHKEKVYCFINETLPICKNPNCKTNKLPKFENFKIGYKDYCSVSCSVKCSKKEQEKSRIINIQEKVKDMTKKEIILGLYNNSLNIQKWRDIDKLKEYKDFHSLEQLYKHIILKENQVCKYCGKIYDYDSKTHSKRKCMCTTLWDREVLKISNLDKKEFLKTLIKYNLHYYSHTKNKVVEDIYRSKFSFKYNNFMKQINSDCEEYDVDFYGYYNIISKAEKEVYNFIKSFYNGLIIENDRSFGVEFDIYLPELKLAIEYDGIYWHSSRFKDKKYHLNKTEIAEENDIHLIHIFENEWTQKKDIVKSILKAKMGFSTNRVYARKCEIREVNSKESNKFLENNHMQGKDNAPIRYGLYFEDELVQLITFKRSHRSKEKYMELKRSASKLGYNVIGGFTKLLKYAKNIINEDIITFADRRYSYKNNIYSKIGRFISTTQPNSFWINGYYLESREKYQKHKLRDLLETFNPNLSAIENCHNNDIYEIYDCGNYKYLL